MKKSSYKIGVDLGGTKIEIILFDRSDSILLRKRIPTPRGMESEYQAIVDAVYQLITETQDKIPEKTGPCTIGIGIPGIYDEKAQKMINANTISLIGNPFKKDLEGMLNRPIGMENDANCFAIAEATMGAARGYNTVFGIILGSGCGGGIVMGGKVHRGRHLIAGEWGHFSLNPKGEACFCGNRGCIETKLSGNGIARMHHRKYGGSDNFESIVKAYRRGDIDCMNTVEKFLDDFGRCVGGMISILDPDAIVIGGGVSNVDEIYSTGVTSAYQYAVFDNPTTPILKHQLGDSAGVYGATWIGC